MGVEKTMGQSCGRTAGAEDRIKAWRNFQKSGKWYIQGYIWGSVSLYEEGFSWSQGTSKGLGFLRW